MAQDASLIKPRCKFSDLVYPTRIMDAIANFIEEESFAHALIEEGLHPKRKILLHGPSGCGKTSIAHAIASEFNLKLLEAPGSLIDSPYVGECEKNIANVIGKACAQKCVLLMDEFDSLAQKRGRVQWADSRVNALLTSLENNAMEGFFIACTNHLDRLDDALLRRFDLVLDIPLPSERVLLEVAEKVLKGRFGIDPRAMIEGAGTPAIVERNCKEALRREVIKMERINPRPKPLVKPQETKPIEIKINGNSFGGGNAHDYDFSKHYERLNRMFEIPFGLESIYPEE